MRLSWLVPGSFACVAIIIRMLLVQTPPAIAADLAQPLVVVTAWHEYGARIFVTLLAAFALGTTGYVAVLRYLLKSTHPDARRTLLAIVAVSASAIACAFAVPVLFSSDIYAYATYGEMALRGINPYSHAALPSGDPLFAAAIWQWSNPPPACVYGPLFVEAARALVALGAPFGIVAQLTGFRVLSSCALLACAPLTYAALRGRETGERLSASAAIALNPVAVWSAAEGHNDALMIAIVLLGFVAMRRIGPFAGAIVVASSALIKAPGLAGALAGAIALHREPLRALRVLGGAAVGTAIVALTLVWFLIGSRAPLTDHGQVGAQISLVALSVPAAIALAAALALYGLMRAWSGDMEGWCWVALGTWVAIPNPNPWYAIWFLPVAALAIRSRAAAAIVALSLTTALRYVPDAIGGLDAPVMLTLSVIAFAPLLLLVKRPAARPANSP
jgi:hypothetical protein